MKQIDKPSYLFIYFFKNKYNFMQIFENNSSKKMRKNEFAVFWYEKINKGSFRLRVIAGKGGGNLLCD